MKAFWSSLGGFPKSVELETFWTLDEAVGFKRHDAVSISHAPDLQGFYGPLGVHWRASFSLLTFYAVQGYTRQGPADPCP